MLMVFVICILYVSKQTIQPQFGAYRSLPVNVIGAWQLGGLSNDMI